VFDLIRNRAAADSLFRLGGFDQLSVLEVSMAAERRENSAMVWLSAATPVIESLPPVSLNWVSHRAPGMEAERLASPAPDLLFSC
jgi:hypothetical protein